MTNEKLNLARKWRAKNFDTIIGQNLSVRMLKNSLYLSHYFPMYLLSGQRGCGKTTTARVFAAALNCASLTQFQKNPKKQSIPCELCDSCMAMRNGTHPDFIEIDAASHTGVDHVRQIIEAASLLPIIGMKKIYLIDEAHMLSKAAFNALLKILEEPPAHVLFILATTDTQKIIDTVKSRCFQLLFKAVDEPILLAHLTHVCAVEKIAHDADGLSLIIHETQGSVRDALNVIEQVRFSSAKITTDTVLQVLDHLDTNSFVQIIELIIARDPLHLLLFLKQRNLERFAADYIWNRFVELMRTLLWLKYGVSPSQNASYAPLTHLVQRCSLAHLHRILEHIYQHEEIFLKTTAQHLFLELFFLQLCQKNSEPETNSSLPMQSIRPSPPYREPEGMQDSHIIDEQDTELSANSPVINSKQSLEHTGAHNALPEHALSEQWQQFISIPAIQNEPLLYSILSQGTPLHTENQNIVVEFLKELSFFETTVQAAHAIWYPHFQQIFSNNAQLVMQFTRQTTVAPSLNTPAEHTAVRKVVVKEAPKKEIHTQQSTSPYAPRHQPSRQPNNAHITNEDSCPIDISDASLWKTTHTVLRHFPGTVRELRQ